MKEKLEEIKFTWQKNGGRGEGGVGQDPTGPPVFVIPDNTLIILFIMYFRYYDSKFLKRPENLCDSLLDGFS